jgi:hypothetical protein
MPSYGGPEQRYRGYWRALLFWGVALSAVGYGLIGAWVASTASTVDYLNSTTSSNGSHGAEGGFGFFFAGLGGILLLPGIIGWGIHASGLTRPRVPPAQRSLATADYLTDL